MYGYKYNLENRRRWIAYGNRVRDTQKSDRDEIATFATLAGLIIVAVLVIDMLGGLFDTLKSLLSLY